MIFVYIHQGMFRQEWEKKILLSTMLLFQPVLPLRVYRIVRRKTAENLRQSAYHYRCHRLNQLDQMRMAYDDVVELFFFLFFFVLRSAIFALLRQFDDRWWDDNNKHPKQNFARRWNYTCVCVFVVMHTNAQWREKNGGRRENERQRDRERERKREKNTEITTTTINLMTMMMSNFLFFYTSFARGQIFRKIVWQRNRNQPALI